MLLIPLCTTLSYNRLPSTRRGQDQPPTTFPSPSPSPSFCDATRCHPRPPPFGLRRDMSSPLPHPRFVTHRHDKLSLSPVVTPPLTSPPSLQGCKDASFWNALFLSARRLVMQHDAPHPLAPRHGMPPPLCPSHPSSCVSSWDNTLSLAAFRASPLLTAFHASSLVATFCASSSLIAFCTSSLVEW